jgi:sensor histidine kinase regulating citrate/malate metabolism
MFNSIQSKLVFFVSAIVIISLSLLSLLIYRTASTSVQYRVEKETLGTSKQLSRQILKSIETNVHILQGLSKTVQTAMNVDEALAEQHKVLTEFGHNFIVNTEGILTNLVPFNYTLKPTLSSCTVKKK